MQTVDAAMQLENLKATERSISATVIKLESEHKALISQHRSNLKHLLQIRQQMDNIRQEFQSITQEYEAFVASNNELVEHINSVAEQRHQQAEILQNLRQSIESLETITICVYTDGRIEPLEETDIQLDETGSDELYHEIITQSPTQCQDLRLRDIKTIARLRAIITNSTHHIELLFDDITLETHYLAFN